MHHSFLCSCGAYVSHIWCQTSCCTTGLLILADIMFWSWGGMHFMLQLWGQVSLLSQWWWSQRQRHSEPGSLTRVWCSAVCTTHNYLGFTVQYLTLCIYAYFTSCKFFELGRRKGRVSYIRPISEGNHLASTRHGETTYASNIKSTIVQVSACQSLQSSSSLYKDPKVSLFCWYRYYYQCDILHIAASCLDLWPAAIFSQSLTQTPAATSHM